MAKRNPKLTLSDLGAACGEGYKGLYTTFSTWMTSFDAVVHATIYFLTTKVYHL